MIELSEEQHGPIIDQAAARIAEQLDSMFSALPEDIDYEAVIKALLWSLYQERPRLEWLQEALAAHQALLELGVDFTAAKPKK